MRAYPHLAQQDANFLGKISGVDLVAKKAWYHSSCRNLYSSRAEQSRRRKSDQTKELSSRQSLQHKEKSF